MEYKQTVDKIMRAADGYCARYGVEPRCVFMNPGTIRWLYYENIRAQGQSCFDRADGVTLRLFGIALEPNACLAEDQFWLNNSRMRDILVRTHYGEEGKPIWTAEIIRADGGPVPLEKAKVAETHEALKKIIGEDMLMLGDDFFPSNKGYSRTNENGRTGFLFSKVIAKLLEIGYSIHGPKDGVVMIEELIDGHWEPVACIDQYLTFHCTENVNDIKCLAGSNNFRAKMLEVVKIGPFEGKNSGQPKFSPTQFIFRDNG